MSASNEWEIQHLTPHGWIAGGFKHDFGNSQEDVVPDDAVLSVRRHVVIGTMGAPSSVDISESETIRMGDTKLLMDLKKQFGTPQFGC